MEESPATVDQLARLAQLESEFRRTLEAEKLEAMAEFAAGAGHEINNPLTVISGRAQLLLREECDPERRHALTLISAQAVRVYEMIADMMLFARPPRPELQPVELVKLIDDVVAEAQAAASTAFARSSAERHTEIRRTGEPGPIVVEADPVQLSVALRAILQNALDALAGGGRIEISIARPMGSVSADSPPESGEASMPPEIVRPKSEIRNPELPREVLIRLRDNGPGMTPEERRHIFDPFYSARQAGRGLGLGLSKAWRIVTNHGGRIDVESQPGRGATFTVAIPSRASG
ncbi:MAG: ATP-binding protein [Thermoguttaceae bacterium]